MPSSEGMCVFCHLHVGGEFVGCMRVGALSSTSGCMRACVRVCSGACVRVVWVGACGCVRACVFGCVRACGCMWVCVALCGCVGVCVRVRMDVWVQYGWVGVRVCARVRCVMWIMTSRTRIQYMCKNRANTHTSERRHSSCRCHNPDCSRHKCLHTGHGRRRTRTYATSREYW